MTNEIFSPFDAAEAMIELKDIAEKVQSKEDIIKYAQETKELLEV